MAAANEIEIHLEIERAGTAIVRETTSVGRMRRSFEELIRWLGRDSVFSSGVIRLRGTGIVPPDDFSLAHGDIVRMTIAGIGTLTNPVLQDRTR